MELKKMTAKTLDNWVKKLQMLYSEETNSHNKMLYAKWLSEAIAEQDGRYNRRMNYLRWR